MLQRKVLTREEAYQIIDTYNTSIDISAFFNCNDDYIKIDKSMFDGMDSCDKYNMFDYLDRNFSSALSYFTFYETKYGEIIRYPRRVIIEPDFGDGEYCTYVHTFPNGKKYVGQCKNTKKYGIKERWDNGNGYKENEEMYKAIQEFGWENIDHKIMISGLSKDCSIAYEHYLIRREDSYRNGYNQNEGGVGRSEFDEEERLRHGEAQKGSKKKKLRVVAVSANLKEVLFFPSQLAAQKHKSKKNKEILNPDGLEGVWQADISATKNKWISHSGYFFFTIRKDRKIHIEEKNKNVKDLELKELTGCEIIYDK